MKQVLFLCTGNYYRSRFAETYFNWHALRRGINWRAESRGLALDPQNIGPISRHTVERLASLDIPTEAWRDPLRACLADFETAHHIVAVKAAEHRPLMETAFPALLSRVEFWNVHDLDCSAPEQALPQLEREVIRLIDRLRDLATPVILPTYPGPAVVPQIADSSH